MAIVNECHVLVHIFDLRWRALQQEENPTGIDKHILILIAIPWPPKKCDILMWAVNEERGREGASVFFFL